MTDLEQKIVMNAYPLTARQKRILVVIINGIVGTCTGVTAGTINFWYNYLTNESDNNSLLYGVAVAAGTFGVSMATSYLTGNYNNHNKDKCPINLEQL